MKNAFIPALALAGIVAAPLSAQAQSRAFATTDVNLRAGPSTSYPVVDVVGASERVRVFGCLDTRAWCDVGYAGIRGWMSSNYLADDYRVQRYTGPTVIRQIGAPVITFSVGNYWGDHYRDRGFYRDRDRYIGHGPRHHRNRRPSPQEAREQRLRDAREARREYREDRREDRREFREERRDDRRDYRQKRREERREAHRDRRENRRDARRDHREDRREHRRGDGPPRPLYRVD